MGRRDDAARGHSREDRPLSYKSSIGEPIPKYWKVTVNEDGDRFTKTGYVGVVAMDVMSACRAVLQAKPTATIVSICHEGPVNVIADETKRIGH
jgi:hypothetical protein